MKKRDRTPPIDDGTPLSEQAAGWWVLLNDGNPGAADHRAFAEWVTRSPDRVQAYLQLVRDAAILSSPRVRWPETSAEELIRAARSAGAEILPLGHPVEAAPTAHPRPARAWRWSLAAAATMCAVAIGVAAWLRAQPLRLQTAHGEQRSVVLDDGSIVTLNTSSVLEVRLRADRRQINLVAGEALFKVAHDAARPFDVFTGGGKVRAVGTEFDVDRRVGHTTVTVVEGKVAVTAAGRTPGEAPAPMPLAAGEQVTLTAGSVGQPTRANVASAIAWTQRKLVFERRRLGEVADEFNRYNRQVIEIRSPTLRSQEVTGVFQADDPDSFLQFLSRLPGVTVEFSPDHQRIIVRQEILSKT